LTNLYSYVRLFASLRASKSSGTSAQRRSATSLGRTAVVL
jgi:hypothetical protein